MGSQEKAGGADPALDARVTVLHPEDVVRDERLIGFITASSADLDVSGGVDRPVILWRQGDGARVIVDGVRRVESALSQGLEFVAAYEFEDMDEEDARNLRELANTFDRGLSLRERSDILKRLSPWAREFEKGRWRKGAGRRGAHPVGFIGSMSGVGIHNATIAFRLADRLHPEAIAAVDEGLLTTKMARELAAADLESQREVIAEIRASGVRGSHKISRIVRAPKNAQDHVEKALEHMRAASGAKGAKNLDESVLTEIATLALDLRKQAK